MKETSYQLFMCGMCGNRVGNLSYSTPNKTACYLCGGFVFSHQAVKACSCLKHKDPFQNNGPNNLIKCCICKMLINGNMPIKPLNASLCNFCALTNSCYHLELN